MVNRKVKDGIATSIIWLSAAIAAGILIAVVVFIFSNGWSVLSKDFLTNNYESELDFANFKTSQTFTLPSELEADSVFSENIGIALNQTEDGFVVTYIDDQSPVREAVNNAGDFAPIKEGYIVEEINGQLINGNTDIAQVLAALNSGEEMSLRILVPGGGVFPMIVSTLILVVVTLALAAPLGILAAIYMVEYAKQGRMVRTIRFATEILTGIPSVVYGLFGFMMFVGILGLGASILAGALTMMILLLPVMMRTTEEALKTVPMSYREASYGLGANKIQTIYKVVLPSAMPGIMVGIILSTGRIVGESAALLFTVGTFAQLPANPATGNLSIFQTGATLTLRAFIEVKEFGNIEMASAIGIVILVIVFTLNTVSRLITKKFSKGSY